MTDILESTKLTIISMYHHNKHSSVKIQEELKEEVSFEQIKKIIAESCVEIETIVEHYYSIPSSLNFL